MTELVSLLPFPNFRYLSQDAAGDDFGVIILKGTYQIDPAGSLYLAEEQAPLIFTDRYHGELNFSSLWGPSDIVPNKPTADVFLNALAHAPSAEPLPEFACGIRISDGEGVVIDRHLRVTGPRWWVPEWRPRLSEDEKPFWKQFKKGGFRGWWLSTPEPVAHVPLRYELAYGGTVTKGVDEDGHATVDCDPRNPIGCGMIDPEWTDHTREQVAPQIETLGLPITDPYKAYDPEGLGPIPPAWEPRLRRAGTYDEHWEANVWPRWASDYQFSFHNAAHPKLTLSRFLKFGDRFELLNLRRDFPRLSFAIPQIQPIAQLVGEDGSVKRSDFLLDTCFIDIAAERLIDARVFLTWRLSFETNLYAAAVLGVSPDDFKAEFEDMKQRAAL